MQCMHCFLIDWTIGCAFSGAWGLPAVPAFAVSPVAVESTSRNSTIVKLVAESCEGYVLPAGSGEGSGGRLFFFLQAAWQARHPMHLVVSTSRPTELASPAASALASAAWSNSGVAESASAPAPEYLRNCLRDRFMVLYLLW